MNEWVAARARRVPVEGFLTCPRCRRAFPPEALICSVDGEKLRAASSLATQPTTGSRRADELPKGTPIAEYIVDTCIGRGGMGIVYRAAHPVIRSRVAIKVLTFDRLADKHAVARFVQEARLANKIRHRNVVDVFSFGKLPDGRAYCVMEYLRGMSLQRRLQLEGPMSLAETLRVLEPVGRTLDAVHAKGIVHRDLKPSNIFLVREHDADQPAFVKLLDFGVAKLLRRACDVHTQTGMVVGTPSFMSPEQLRGKHLDTRSDVYGLGVVAYQMLTGMLPFRAGSSGDLLYQQRKTTPVPPSQRVRGLSPAVDAVVLRALHPDSAKRYAKASELVAALASADSPKPWSPWIIGGKPLWMITAFAVIAAALKIAVAHASDPPAPVRDVDAAEVVQRGAGALYPDP